MSGYRLGMICRADQGGLAAQTYEAWRHLRPARTVLMDLGHAGRGRARVEDYTEHDWPGEVVVVHGAELPGGAAAWLAEAVDVIFTAETTYGAHVPEVADAHGAQVVVQANPELYREADYPGARIVLPTSWEADRVPHERVLPVPLALDSLPWRRRERLARWYHPSAPAMADRNGTSLVASALAHLDGVALDVRGPDGARLTRRRTRARVPVRQLAPHDGPYHEAWPTDVDAVVIPRRYGGNFMPAQEAAALGLPVVALDLEPHRAWPHVVPVPTTTALSVAMRGGRFDVWACDPLLLAQVMRELAGDPERLVELGLAGREWAEARSWDALEPAYREALAPC